jgi:hypothetical protein
VVDRAVLQEHDVRITARDAMAGRTAARLDDHRDHRLTLRGLPDLGDELARVVEIAVGIEHREVERPVLQQLERFAPAGHRNDLVPLRGHATSKLTPPRPLTGDVQDLQRALLPHEKRGTYPARQETELVIIQPSS